MAKRLWVYVSKTKDRAIARVAEQADAQAQADAMLGLANWTEYDLTADVASEIGRLVDVARERLPTHDGTGRWRWRTISDCLKRWVGAPVEETCERCGQRVTTA